MEKLAQLVGHHGHKPTAGIGWGRKDNSGPNVIVAGKNTCIQRQIGVVGQIVSNGG